MKIFIGIILFLYMGSLAAQTPVVVRGETLFVAKNSDVAKSAEIFIDSLINTGNTHPDSVFVERNDSAWGVGYGDSAFIWLYIPPDSDMGVITTETCAKFQDFLKSPPQKIPLGLSSLFRLLIALLSPIVFVLLVLIFAKITRKMIKYFLNQEGKMIRGVKFGKFSLLPARDELMLFINIIRWVRNIIVLILFYGMMLFIFYLYPATRSFANRAFLLTLQAIQNVGIVILDIIAFAMGALVLYAVARIFAKIVDIVFRHYEQSEKLKIPIASLKPMRTLIKIAIALIFVVVFIAVLPGPGGTIAIAVLFLIIIIIGLSLLPLFRQYIAGYTMIFREILKPGDKIFYKNETWKIDKISPLFIDLTNIEDDKKLVISADDLLSGGVVFKPDDEPLSAEKEKDDSDFKNLDIHTENL